MVSIIAAIGKNNALGKDNDLIWHLPADLKRFKRITSGHTIIMGRKTFESIGKPLPNRTSIIISRNQNYRVNGCHTVHSLEEALFLTSKEEKVFIIGGAQIYKQAITQNLANQLDITIVHENFDADVFFPQIEPSIWQEIKREDFYADETNKYNYSFITYELKS